jgi:hypothetical protein
LIKGVLKFSWVPLIVVLVKGALNFSWVPVKGLLKISWVPLVVLFKGVLKISWAPLIFVLVKGALQFSWVPLVVLVKGVLKFSWVPIVVIIIVKDESSEFVVALLGPGFNSSEEDSWVLVGAVTTLGSEKKVTLQCLIISTQVG